ncbi:MAG: aminotransferase class V-fold PLP-dependent enzyme [Blastomonas sp.]|jgi:selenocysteine lyase/cysteine desulfurase|uniref:aminotransferase class V-fold PLP-dependent enzyme n=1 Tax=Blastomonas sp. TaxID=1909299 RepID=UPI00258EC9AE|nr:aminotransferase class V-fold PLP-dependent enzyme [Blastomonas sp.]MCO5792493.1 aminotransferase class V-fold PLP-dependent enzyme [Blastomonas sp.]
MAQTAPDRAVAPHPNSPFDTFRSAIDAALAENTLAQAVIGKGLLVDGPFGPVRLLYADYAASGRALSQVEHFVMNNVLPIYANPHTQASFCGRSINALRRAARAEIARFCSAGCEDAVIFAGSGATAGIQKLVRLFGADRLDEHGRRPVVLVGPYEHHSNLLPWRESLAEVIELPESDDGGPDLVALAAQLRHLAGRHVICTFSAGSNVTGALTNVAAVSRIVKAHGARVIWDYAGAGPYLPMTMHPASDVHVDALVTSPHKFMGGPGASGLLVVRRDAVLLDKPTSAGGGTVSFVTSEIHDYLDDVTAREEAGTPNAIADIRAALAFIVRDCIMRAGLDVHAERMRSEALDRWRANGRIEILGPCHAKMLPIVAFRVRDTNSKLVHHQLITRILSDCFGVQARGGCACAGPYLHRLLDIDPVRSESIRAAVKAGRELEKPGFVRVTFSPLMDVDEFTALVDAVDEVARDSARYAARFHPDPETAVFEPVLASQ